MLKKSDDQYGKSRHFKLKICISCLRDKVYIFSLILVKLARFLHLINGFNPVDSDKKKDVKSVREKYHFKLKDLHFLFT